MLDHLLGCHGTIPVTGLLFLGYVTLQGFFDVPKNYYLGSMLEHLSAKIVSRIKLNLVQFQRNLMG